VKELNVGILTKQQIVDMCKVVVIMMALAFFAGYQLAIEITEERFIKQYKGMGVVFVDKQAYRCEKIR
jgi:hypothetical protein